MPSAARLPAVSAGRREIRAERAGDAALEALTARLKARHAGRIAGECVLPARAAQWAEFPEALDGRVRAAFERRGIARLYSHQRAAWDAIQAGRDVVVVTPTASGKTLCYNLPVLDAVVAGGAKALYLFPTKALAQDQVAEVNELNRAGTLGVRAYTFDGDTPGDARKAVRTRGDIVVTNPDMLHQAVLPHHTKWAQFFESLRYVVIDEVHGYRGVFGSHVANVIRRLKRICAFYGASPRFVLCSATIGNPREHAEALLGSGVAAITDSGAPQGAKHLLLWNPPVVNPDLGIRASARSQSTRIARAAIKAGFKTIVFAQSRLMVEVLTKYLKDVFDHDPRKPARIHAYRGGYLPQERRATERRLRAGEIDGVVSTSALELGVDVGALDVCVLNGYPGTIAGTWQRLGRAGRRTQTALGVLVAGSDPLDQYVVRHPEFFFDASPEHARIAPDQLLILLDHVRCAAFELPFRAGEAFGAGDDGSRLPSLLRFLEEQSIVHRDGDQWHWIADSYPANAVNLRSVADGNFVVIDRTDGRKDVIAEVDYSSAALTLYEGAIHLIQSRPWQVEHLDWVGRKAYVTRTDADYYTDAIDFQKLKVLECFEQAPAGAHAPTLGRAEAGHGEVHLVRRVTGYKKIRYYTHENVGYGPVNLPDQEMHTTALWWRCSAELLERAFASRWQALDGLLGAAYVLHTVAVLRAMAEPRDLGKAVGSGQGEWSGVLDVNGRGRLHDADANPLDVGALARFEPTVFLYDNYPGGTGLAQPLWAQRAAIVRDAAALVRGCPCRHGCPACVGPVLPGDEADARAPKQAALAVLGLIADD
jgi:DEAD/DEAH box helicase domain-containing protein